MADLIREAPIGQIIRYLTNDRVLRFPEELPDFKLPESYAGTLESASRTESRPGCAFACEKGCHSESTPNCRRDSHSTRTSASEEQEKISSDLNILNVEAGSIRDLDRAQSMVPIHASLSRTSVQGHSHPPTGLEHHLTTTTISRAPSQQIIPQRTSDGAILVDWYTTDDPANPQNWSLRKKIFAGTIVCLYTLAVYMVSVQERLDFRSCTTTHISREAPSSPQATRVSWKSTVSPSRQRRSVYRCTSSPTESDR